MAKKANELAHTKWMCKYHIVFTPKYRRKVIYNQYKEDLREVLKQLCNYKGVQILEGHIMPDHVRETEADVLFKQMRLGKRQIQLFWMLRSIMGKPGTIAKIHRFGHLV